MKNEIKKIVEKLKNSNYCVALTGAGISTESGIPDFRSKDTGIYNYISDDIFSIELFYKKPEVFYNFAKNWVTDIITKKPNKAHIVLAELEKKGILKSVITQNIDNLHHTAGSKNVYEVHGTFMHSHCMKCNKEYDFHYIKEELIDKNNVPVRCRECNGLVKPDIVFFGEQLPQDYLKAIEETKKADLMLILGTSLAIYPVGMLPNYCHGDIIIINRDPTPLDYRAYVVLRANLSEAFEAIEKEL